MVVLWKCGSIRAILDAVQYLYRAPMVSDLHTIPAILANSIREKADAPRIGRDELPLTMARYVVRSAGLAGGFFKDFPLPSGQSPLFTAGIKDLTWIQEHWSTLELRLQGVIRFLRGWESLMDKVLRTDGRFSQQPGFCPALCDIPSSLLEFYLAFTTQAGQIMQMGSEPSRRFSLILAPKL